MDLSTEFFYQLEKVLFFPQTVFQWVFLGIGGVFVLLFVGSWFAKLFSYQKGFPKLLLALSIMVVAGLLGASAGNHFLEPLVSQTWWPISAQILGFVFVQLILAWPLSKFLLGADSMKIFFFAIGVSFVSWGVVFAAAQALQTGSDTGSRMEEIEERQRIRTGEDL